MRIALLLDRYLPSPLSSAKMFYDLATELARLGHEVTVVAGDSSLQQKVTVSQEDRVTVVRVKSGEIRHPSKVMRTLNELLLSRIIWKLAKHYFKSHPFDLVICYSPTIFWSYLITKLKALYGCRAYLVLRDLFPQWALDAGLLKKRSFPYWFFKRHELKLYDSADVIGVQSPANLDYFVSHGLSNRYHLEVLFNWTKVENRPPVLPELRARLGLQDQVIFMYGGNLGVAQDMDNVLRLAKRLKNEENIFFLLLGEGSEASRLVQEIRDSGLKNIRLLPAVSHVEYQKILAECDVGLITLRRDLKTQNFPGKMLSYMELQKPMLASINPGNDLSAVLQEYEAGFACENGDDDTFSGYALKLACDPELRHRMGKNAYKLLHDKFDVASAARQITAHFS